MTRAAPVPRTCPSCHAFVVPGRATCISCGMQVTKMADFAAAERAAGRRGFQPVGRQDAGGGSPLMKRVMIALTLIAVFVIGAMGYRAAFPPAPAVWKTYPTDRDTLVQQFFTLIHEDTDASLDKAYALISRRAKDLEDTEEDAKYRQTYHDLARYLTGEFGADWIETLRIEHNDGKDGSLGAIVAVQTEKFHLPLDLQGPDGSAPEQLAGMPEGQRHYGVRGVDEFPTGRAAKSQQHEAIAGVLRGVYGADRSVEQLTGILNTAGSPAHETAIDTKRRLLPIVRNPNATGLHRALYQLWPVRNDPTVKARLETIMGDQRYDQTMRDIAKRVHDGTETEDVLTGMGVVVP